MTVTYVLSQSNNVSSVGGIYVSGYWPDWSIKPINQSWVQTIHYTNIEFIATSWLIIYFFQASWFKEEILELEALNQEPTLQR